jgi:hypothetical protein
MWKTAVSGKPLVLGVPVITTVTVFFGSNTIFQNVSPTESIQWIYFGSSIICAEV